MKKIGIDARLLRQTGVGTYLKNFLHYLERQKFPGLTFYVYLTAKDFNIVNFKNKSLVKRKADFRWHTASEQLGYLWALYKDNLDLMHFTYFGYPIFYWRKFIATVHDTTPLLFKTGKASTKNQFIYRLKYLAFKLALWLQVARAAKIITPTKSVKRELTKIYGDKISRKIKEIYEGINYRLFDTKENQSLSKKYRNFFLYVGNFYPHKNVERLVEAFSKLKGKPTLILVGPDDYFTDRLEPKVSAEKNIHIVKNPPTADLIYFYKKARALVHPSLSEGFGLPIIEAAHFGRPIIASNIPVFKELLGDSYTAFEPDRVEDITRAVGRFLAKKTKPDYSKVLKRFSFEKMTEETLNIYRNIVK